MQERIGDELPRGEARRRPPVRRRAATAQARRSARERLAPGGTSPHWRRSMQGGAGGHWAIIGDVGARFKPRTSPTSMAQDAVQETHRPLATERAGCARCRPFLDVTTKGDFMLKTLGLLLFAAIATYAIHAFAQMRRCAHGDDPDRQLVVQRDFVRVVLRQQRADGLRLPYRAGRQPTPWSARRRRRCPEARAFRAVALARRNAVAFWQFEVVIRTSSGMCTDDNRMKSASPTRSRH